MRLRSPEHHGCRETMTCARLIRAAAVLSAIGSSAWFSEAAAQQARADVAHVEAVNGRVVASSQGAPVLAEALDVINDGARLDLQAGSELRICHYRMRKLLTLKGPLRVSVSADGVTSESGRPVAGYVGTCAPPAASTFHGGIAARGLGPPSAATPNPARK